MNPQYYKNLSLENLNEEQWKDIEGFPGKYQVSNFGRIKSSPKIVTLFHGGSYVTPERMLKQRKSGGYLFVALFDGYNRKDIQAHILVANAFLPNPERKREVNHKLGIKDDNRVTEIEWNTQQENTLHAYRTGLMRPNLLGKKGFEHPSTKKILCLITGRITTIKDAARWLSISSTHMVAMLKGMRTNWTNFIYH